MAMFRNNSNSMVYTGVVDPEPKWFQMVELEPEIWVPVLQAQFVGKVSFANVTMVFGFQWTIVPGPEPRTSRCPSRTQKI